MSGKEDYLLFVTGNKGLSIQTGFVVEVIENKEVYTLSLLPSCLSGIISHKRRLIPLINQSFLFSRGLSSEVASYQGNIFIILNTSALFFALKADKIVNTIEGRVIEDVNSTDNNDNQLISFRRGFLNWDNRLFQVIDVEHLIRDIMAVF